MKSELGSVQSFDATGADDLSHCWQRYAAVTSRAMDAAKMTNLRKPGGNEMMGSLEVDAAEESLQVVEVV